MEDKVYICGWRQEPGGFTLWLKSRPTVCGEGPDYASAENKLLEAIWNNNGAAHAVLEFDPPLPKGELEAKYSQPELYLIGGDDTFQTDAPRGGAFESNEDREKRFTWVDDFFATPICRTCAGSSGVRSERPLRLTYAPSRADGAFGFIGAEAGTRIEIVSEDFLRLLAEAERAQLNVREVIRKRKGRKFYEIIGPAGPPFVAVSSLSANGWRCEECSRACWGYWHGGLPINNFVAAKDLADPLPGLFTVGTPPELYLCATGPRWRELVGKLGVRGFTSRALGVVQDHEVIRNPKLPSKERGRDAILRAELSK